MAVSEKINTIGKDYTIGGIIKFSIGPVMSRLFTSLLMTLDDGLFISRYCGTYALAAFSIAMPWFMIVDAVAMLLGCITTKCSILMGEKNNEEADRAFSTMIGITFFIGCILTLILTIFRRQILTILGATETLMDLALSYMNVSRFYLPLILISSIFNRSYIIAGKPKMNVLVTVLSTVLNFFFDWIFIVKLQTGLAGTAYANLISNIFVTLIGLFFYSDKSRELHFSTMVDEPLKLFEEIVKLGRSSALTSLAISLNSYVANLVLLHYASENGVAAFTIVNNVQFMFMNSYFGMLGSVCPIASYAYGEKNKEKLVKTLKQIVVLTTGLSVCIFILYTLFKKPLISLYLMNSDHNEIEYMVEYGMLISPFALFVFAYNLIVQELLSSLSNYKASTVLSMIENVLLSNISIVLLPYLFGIDGVWYNFLATELVMLIITMYTVYKNQDVYGYGKAGIASALD